MKLPGNPGTFFLMRFDQPLAHFGKSFLGQFALGDVPRDRGSADDHALLISDRGNSDSNVDSLATFRDTDRFVVVDPLTGCQASQNFLLLVVQFGRHEPENSLSNRFFLRVPKHLPRTSVPGSNRTFKLFEMIASWEDSTMPACRNRSSCVVLLSLMSSTIATTSEEGRLFNSEILRRPQISEPSRRKKRLSS